MRGRFTFINGTLLGLLFVTTWQHADAVIKADTPLKAIEGSAVYIVVGKVETYYADKPAMLVNVTEDIKGKAAFRKMPINCKVADARTAKENQIEPLLKRLGPDLDIIFFVTPRGKNLITFAFTNGTWFQLTGTQTGEKDQVVFGLKSAEPYYHKSFRGTTAELRRLLKDHAAGNATLPPLDAKVQPGFGPEYTPKQKSQGPRLLDVWRALNRPAALPAQGSLFAVIPTIGLGAPLAILALLFPTVFGGVFVLFRQWMAFITLISLNSTVVLLHWWFAPTALRGTWWSTDAALWFMMTLFTFVCTIWAWRRQLNALAAGDPDAPQKTELAVLCFMTASCAGATFVMAYFSKAISWVDVGWTMTVVMTLGVFAGALYRLFQACNGDSVFAAPPLPTEGIILGSMLLGHLAFAPGIWGGNIGTDGAVHAGEPTGDLAAKVVPVVKKWDFTAEGNGIFASSPLVAGDAVYAAYSSTSLRVATMVRLDRHTGKVKWEFIGKDGDLVQMISTPCLADGKLYFGEGFHDDKNCRVFCVNADSGEEVWHFKTAGQTESSPAVANGKVYIGAGNDGVYCLDAKTGQQVWNFPPANYQGRLLRFGGGMRVVGDRLYCGTGVDRNQSNDKGETAAFCLDASTGKFLWKSAVPYPVWSTPVVKDEFVYITTGNGDVFEDAQPPETPGGALVCLDAKTGIEAWRFTTKNGIIEAPALDGHRLYFGCRDGQLYCMNHSDGSPRWTASLGSPIIGTPVLDTDSTRERTFNVYATASGGKVCCVNPQTGNIVWTYDLTQKLAYISSSPRLAVTRSTSGYRTQLYFGCGLGGGQREVAANRPVFYCLENVE